MNREIKFRGRTSDGAWKYGNYHKFIEDDGEVSHCIVSHTRNEFCAEVTYYDVDPDTVGQFTGLTDKNGVEIYEGDVVMFFESINSKHEIVYHNGAFGYFLYSEGHIVQFCPINHLLSNTRDYDIKEHWYVMGNRFDHPELLTDKTE